MKIKKFLSVCLSIVLLFSFLPLTVIESEAASYPSVTLNVPWYSQRRVADCGIASVAMVEAYIKGYGKNDDTVYNAVWKTNGESVTLSSYAALGYSIISNTLENIYNKLKAGDPVIVYRTGNDHYSVVYGYNGSTSTLQKSGFLVLNTYRSSNGSIVANPGTTGKTNLESWLNGNTWKHTMVRTENKIPLSASNYSSITDSNFSNIYTSNISETDATIHGYFKTLTTVKGCGFYIGTSETNLTKITKNLSGNADAGGRFETIFYAMSKWYGPLKAGTKYYYKFWYTNSSGKEITSPVNWFLTSGTTETQEPTVATMMIDNVYRNLHVGDTAHLYVNSNDIEQYEFFILKDGEQFYTTTQAGYTLDYACEEPGLYEAYATVSNAAGSLTSDRAKWMVIPELPAAPHAVTTASANGHNYTLYLSYSSWDDAKEFCEDNGGYLMTLTNADEQALFESLVAECNYGSFWLGGKLHNGEFSWITCEEFSYANWLENEPSSDDEEYLGTYKSTQWNDFTVESPSICGFVMETGSIDEENTDHPWFVTVTEGTCTADTTAEYECTLCGATKMEILYPAKGHDYGDWEYLSTSQHWRICNNNQGHVETENHNWDDGVVTKEATCTETGIRTYTCSVCGGTMTSEIPVDPDAHPYVYVTPEIAPTCVTDGSTSEEGCSFCDTVLVPATVIPATGEHDWIEIGIGDGFCDSPTIYYYGCPECNATKEEQFGPSEHAWGAWVSVSDTQHQRICGMFANHIETENHNWDDGVVTKEPSATQSGIKTYTCTVCDGTKTESIDPVPSVDSDAPQYEIISAAGRAGESVTVYVAIKNNPGIISLRNSLSYDTSALELTAVENTGLLNGFTTPSATITSPYTLRWADSLAAENNTENGNIVKLTFTIKDSTEEGSYNISVSPTEARSVDGTKVSFSGASSYITVIAYIPGDADGDGEVTDWDAIVLNRYLAAWDVTVDPQAADVDKDGEVTDWDAIVLERYLAGWDITLE